jgi:hypothetical protein
MNLARESAGPPAAKGTTIRTGLLGHDCAKAAVDKTAEQDKANTLIN